MKKKVYRLISEMWLYPGETANWHFITLPKKSSDEINKNFGDKRRGWGSIPVKITIGKTVWATSIFPDKRSGSYLLPIKAKVRKKEGIYEGDKVRFILEIKL